MPTLETEPSVDFVHKVTSLCHTKPNQPQYHLQTFPYALFSLAQKPLLNQRTMRVKYSFTMNRKDFVEKLRPLLKFRQFDEFTEKFYDDAKNSFMNGNCWIKKVQNNNGKSYFSIKSTIVENNATSSEPMPLLCYPAVKLDQTEKEKWSSDKHELFGMLEVLCSVVLQSYQFKVHRTVFEFKDNPNVMLHVDRVSFENNGYIVYSLFGDILSNDIKHLSDNEIIREKSQLDFKEMKPCRSKVIQFLFNNDSELGIYSGLEKRGNIPKLDYVTISLFEYEAQRIRCKWEEFNKNVEESDRKSPEYIDIMEKAALAGQATITYEDEDGNERPYYSDDEDDDAYL